jgi:hypothetical protein
MNEKVIWDFIYSRCANPYGAAALMGNLMAESSLNPRNVTGSKDPNYVQKADAGTIDFVHDGHAFGLVQWCFRTRKEGLLNSAKASGASVGDINIQLNYMWKELKESYKTAYNAIMNAINIREASDVIMIKYEKPANTSETMKQKRANYGQQFFNTFASGEKQETKPTMKKVVITKDRVNLRAGNGKNFTSISQVNKNAMYEWVATAENGWHAIKLPNRVVWVSGEFSKVQ